MSAQIWAALVFVSISCLLHCHRVSRRRLSRLLRLSTICAVVTAVDFGLLALELLALGRHALASGACLMTCRAVIGSDVLLQLPLQLLWLLACCELVRQRLERRRLLDERLLQLLWWAELLLYLVCCMYAWTWVLTRPAAAVCTFMADCWLPEVLFYPLLAAQSWLAVAVTAVAFPMTLRLFGSRSEAVKKDVASALDPRVLALELLLATAAVVCLLGVILAQQAQLQVHSGLVVLRIVVLPAVGCASAVGSLLLEAIPLPSLLPR